MANSLDKTITEEGHRNVVVKWAGVLDTSDFALTPALALLDMKNNITNATLVGFRIDLIEWSISQGLELVLEWNGAIPQQIFPIAGRGRIASDNYGGFSPDRTRAGYDGSINLRSKNYAAGSIANFTVALELVKRYR